ncbi:MAG TPA: hypothetical protein VIH88_04480 [Candidatus Acidoferrales bacterium]
MKKFIVYAMLSAVAVGAWSCGSSSTPPATGAGASGGDKAAQNSAAAASAAPGAPAIPAVPDEIQKAAETALGSETEVLLYGDLAKNGARQILAVNRIKATPQVTMPGTVITRGVILENVGGTWKEILRCDEHLENPKGFLGNIPLAPVNGWRLQYEQDNDKGLLLYFTPAANPKGARMLPVEVRWNAKAKRYQSMDRNFENFLYELPALETPESQVRL